MLLLLMVAYLGFSGGAKRRRREVRGTGDAMEVENGEGLCTVM